MIESSIKTIGSCELKFDKLVVLTSMVEKNPSFGVVLKDDEFLQKEEGEAIMPPVNELVISANDREELACSNSQEKVEEKVVRQAFGITTALENQSFTLIENTVFEGLEVINIIIQEEGRQLLKIAKAEEEDAEPKL